MIRIGKYVSLDDLRRMRMKVFIRSGRRDGELFSQTDGITWYAIDKLEKVDAESIDRSPEDRVRFNMLDDLSCANYGKRCYFRGDDGLVYSRYSGEYMTLDQAIGEFKEMIRGWGE